MNAVAAHRPPTEEADHDLLRRTLAARVYEVARETALESAPLLSDRKSVV